MDKTQYLAWVRNTLEVGLLVVIVTILICVPAAYALARLTGRRHRTLPLVSI